MYTDICKIRLLENVYAYIQREKGVWNTCEMFKIELKKYIGIIDTLANTDLRNLSDKEYFNLISSVYSISLEKKDYLNIISKRYNKKFNNFIEIGTFMTFTGRATEGHGRNFDWWEQLYQIRYIVAVSEDFNINEDTNFSKYDIRQMIDNKKIVIVKNINKPLNKPINKKEKAQNFPQINLDIYSKENFPIFVSLLRRKFTKKKILKDMKDYIIELQYQMNCVLQDFDNDYDCKDTSRVCNQWFNFSDEKQTYAKLLKKFDIDK